VEVPTEVYSLLNAATFATLTNVNFDDARFKVRGGAGADVFVCEALVSDEAHHPTCHALLPYFESAPFDMPCPPALLSLLVQEYIAQAHSLRDGLERMVRQVRRRLVAGVQARHLHA